MSARTSEDVVLSIPRCTFNGTSKTNGTCIDHVDRLFQAFSSTVVLIVLIAVIIGIIIISLITFHLHKRKMKKRKIIKAQEEYERDNCCPKAVKGKPDVRQTMMVRPGQRAPTAVRKSEPNMSCPDFDVTPGPDNGSKADTGHTKDRNYTGNVLKSVEVS